MDAPRTFHLHMISDATGETLVVVAKAVREQYSQVRAIEHIHPLGALDRDSRRPLEHGHNRRGGYQRTVQPDRAQTLSTGTPLAQPVERFTSVRGSACQAVPSRWVCAGEPAELQDG